MTEQRSEMAQEYLAALEACARGGDETALTRAYEMGRQALTGGLGLLDVIEMHEHALGLLLASAPAAEHPSFRGSASAFLREVLSAFEMALRGYRQTNEELTETNKALLEQRDALETLNRELESFSYSVSHDLRAPLRSIDGFSKVLVQDYGDRLDEEGRRYLGRVRDAAQHMGRLIEALLGLSRITRTPLHRSQVDLGALARRIAERLQAAAPERRGEFTIPDGLIVRGDEALLGVLLENLLGNAWKFTAKRDVARIEVGSGEKDGRRFYFVRDNGAGFDMRYASKLFGAFQRLHSSREFEGTGIGLATVQRVVHRHRGEVWAEAQVDKGATVFFTLGEEESAP